MSEWFSEKHSEHALFSFEIKKRLFEGQSDFQKVEIVESYEFGRVLIIDGFVMITEKDECIYHDMITHVAMATNPDIKKVLVIGGGDGGTVRELTRYQHIEEIVMVEIDSMVVEASRQFLPFTSEKLNDPRVRLLIEDGINYVEHTQEVFDLIIVDSTDPFGPGEGLFSQDFYNDCYRILSQDGIMINQNESPFYQDTAYEMRRASQKLAATFPIMRVYQFHMPTYPSGHWLFGFASKTYDPLKDLQAERWQALQIYTKYYNTDLHRGCFMLPTYVKEMLEGHRDTL